MKPIESSSHTDHRSFEDDSNKNERQYEDNKGITKVDRSKKILKKKDELRKWHLALDVGQKLEMIEVQICVSVLIYLDLIVFTAYYVLFQAQTSYIDASTAESEQQSFFYSNNGDILERFLSSILNFTMFVFILEVALLLYSFQSAFFSHLGYAMDFFIVAAVLYDHLFDLELFPIRFLCLLRVWRIARVAASIVSRIEREHDITKSELIRSESKTNRANLDLKRLQASCKNEIDLRKQVEKMLGIYKDEIQIMREALQVAAMDVTEISRNKIGARNNGGILNETNKSENIDPVKIEGDIFFGGSEGENL